MELSIPQPKLDVHDVPRRHFHSFMAFLLHLGDKEPGVRMEGVIVVCLCLDS